MKRAGRIFAVASVAISITALLILWKFLGLLQGSVRVSSTDPSDYGQWDLPECYSTLLTFPEEIPSSASDIEYHYRYADGGGRPMCQIFLSCALNEEDFSSETERLSSAGYLADDRKNALRLDEESFLWPAWVAIAGYDFCYEFAMADTESRTMVYIYAMNTLEKDLDFLPTYLPDYYMKDYEDLSVDNLDCFTIYNASSTPD